MGCMKSKIRNEETLNRNEERKQCMEHAVTAFKKFPAAHSAYAMFFKNVGAALSHFVHGEVVYPADVGGGRTLPPPLPPKADFLSTNVPRSTLAEGKTKGRRPSNTNLLQIFVDLDDCFLNSSESAHDISRLAEATRLHYQSDLADERDDGVDNFNSENLETHAAVLDKMVVWEGKLCDEVKAGEQMNLEYLKKVASLNKLKRRDSNTDALKRMEARVSSLHTRCIVDMQSMDSTVSEINIFCDDQLYPKLVNLVDAMATTWETMRMNHQKQYKIVRALRNLDISQFPIETSFDHYKHTMQLCDVVHEWNSHFRELMSQQKEYIKALNNWVKLNLIPIDKNSEKVSSPRGTQNTQMQKLLHTWHDCLQKIPDEPPQYAISNFADVIHTIRLYQSEEFKLSVKCVYSRKEHTKRAEEFDNWYKKFMQRRAYADRAHYKDPIAERQKHVEAARLKLKGDEEAYQRQCIQVRKMSLMSLKNNLPVLFKELLDFSRACSDMYSNLRSFTRNHKGEVMVDEETLIMGA